MASNPTGPRLIKAVEDLSKEQIMSCQSVMETMASESSCSVDLSEEAVKKALARVFLDWNSSKNPGQVCVTPPARSAVQELHHVGYYVRYSPSSAERIAKQSNASFGYVPPISKRAAKAKDGERQKYYIQAYPDFELEVVNFRYTDGKGKPIDHADLIEWLPNCETTEQRC